MCVCTAQPLSSAAREAEGVRVWLLQHFESCLYKDSCSPWQTEGLIMLLYMLCKCKKDLCGLGCVFPAHPLLKDECPSMGLWPSLVKTWSAPCSAAEPWCAQGCAWGQVPQSSYCRVKPFPNFPLGDIFMCLTQRELQIMKGTIKNIFSSLCTRGGHWVTPHFPSNTLRPAQGGGASGCPMGGCPITVGLV